MRAHAAILLLVLAMSCATGSTQTVTPSITIGTHVLTLGMAESSVLDQLGSDLELRHLGTGKFSSWMVEHKTGGVYELVGNVVFSERVLSAAIRYWNVEGSSSKSLFYALNDAVNRAESDGYTTCTISTHGDSKTIRLSYWRKDRQSQHEGGPIRLRSQAH